MQRFGVRPELECFDLGMINYGKYLIRKLDFQPPFYWNLLFGNIAGWQADPLSIGAAISQIPDHSHISLAGLGEAQLTVTSLAAALGYGIRTGIEDNLWYDRGRNQLATNMDLLQRTHHLLAIHEREVMSSSTFGKLGFYHPSRHHSHTRV